MQRTQPNDTDSECDLDSLFETSVMDETRDRYCPVCSSELGESFFTMNEVPSMDGALCHSVDESLEWPTGNISLTFCDRCAYVGNVQFDPARISYGPYHFSLHHSPYFDDFVSGQVTHLVEKYGLHGCRILDIGCGAGDFLHSFAQATRIDGLGIDPGIDASRETSVESSRIRLQKKMFQPDDGAFAPDLICVRHVVDALQSPMALMNSIRESIGDRRDCLVYCEVPNAMKYLANNVVWNIVYEHRSWFTKRCLCELFSRSGFDVVSIYECWSDEYLAVEARPAAALPGSCPDLLDDVNHIRGVVDQFAINSDAQFRLWRERLRSWKESKKKVAVWGAGARAITLLHQVDPDRVIGRVVDINPYRQRMFLPQVAVEVHAPECLVEYQPDIVVISNPAFAGEIQTQASNLGITASFEIL